MGAPIELRQLRDFVAVAKELHFGRAAERLHMSQSPLSRAIRDLGELGAVLFVRTTRRAELTTGGTVLLERGRRAMAEIDGAIADAQRSDQPAVVDALLATSGGHDSTPPLTRPAKSAHCSTSRPVTAMAAGAERGLAPLVG